MSRWFSWSGWVNRSPRPLPIHVRRGLRPTFGRLEPRIVLDASAVLNDLGQLVITGTAAADTVKLQVDAVGDLTLYNQDDQIIPITGHPGASETDPLSQSSVTSNQIIVSLAGGDDVFEAQLPSGLDVNVLDSAGFDTVSLVTTSSGPIRESSYSINAESITLNQNASSSFDLLDDQLRLTGDVHVGEAGAPFELNVNSGDLLVEGRLILGGDVDITATSGRVFLNDATVTADAADASLSIHLGNDLVSGASIDFGRADDSGGYRLEDLSITTASSITAERGPIEIDGGLRLTSETSTVSLDGLISADVIDIEANGNVTINGDPITTNQIQIASGGGDVNLYDSNDGLEVKRIDSGGGDVTIEVRGDAADLRISESIRSQGGDIVLLVDRDIIIDSGAIVDAAAGTIRLESMRDVYLTGLRTLNASDGAVTVLAESGSIIDSGDANLDIDADFGRVILTSLSGIGVGNALETSIDRLQATATQSGSIEIIESNAIRLESVITTDGAIRVSAGADILVGQIVADNDGDVFLFADDDILTLGATSFIVADDLSLESGNVFDDGDSAIDLNTNINSITAVVFGTNRGDIEIREQDSIELAADDSGQLDRTVQTSNGEIRILAGENIMIADQRDPSANSAFEVTPKVIALGDNGRIRLDAGNGANDQLTIGNGVAIVASQSTLGAIQLDAANIVLGEQIEIRTGGDVGVARSFSPRPVIGAVDPAFYDPNSIRTNRLQQANANDGEGILTIDIGQTGERGLTLNIDWGAETGRYQQVDSIVGGQPTSVSHVYTEQDILNSTLNGRPSATAPLEVRFSVRHHESIIVTGDTVTQGVLDPNPTLAEELLPIRAGETERIATGVVSATDNDNPLRPDLNANFVTNTVFDNASLAHLNGVARFIIPNLTIPVAFFPVRDVLPEPEELELVVRTETTLPPKSTSVETSEASASPSSTREEYFQIRVLSPDPLGDDLAEPQRLPDNILEGDMLKRLFANLPDGRYAIDYILGDGNERTIIEVDVRNGEPITSGDELDGGYLELKRLDQLPAEALVEPADLAEDQE